MKGGIPEFKRNVWKRGALCVSELGVGLLIHGALFFFFCLSFFWGGGEETAYPSAS